MKTLQDLVSNLENKEGIAISFGENKNELQHITFKELYNTINSYSRGFIELGLQKGDSIALFSGNNPQWLGISLGANNTGLIDIPRAETSTANELEYILAHSKPKVLIVENEKVLNKIDLAKHPEITSIYSIQNINGVKNIRELEKLGEQSKAKLFPVEPNDVAGRIYTSGTTADPKGVESTHYNFISNVLALQKMLHLTTKERSVSYLPPWHQFERVHKYLGTLVDMNAYYAEISSLTNALKIQEPTIFITVPRILIAVHDKVLDKVYKSGFGKVFEYLYPIALDYHKQNKGLKKALEYIPHKIADKLFFEKVRKAFGNKVKYLVCGSAKLPKHIEDFFVAAGMDVLEGYGLTETSPVISARVPGKKMYYTVGLFLEGIEGKILDPNTNEKLSKGVEGILHVRGPNVMKGYFDNIEETNKVLTKDGWFNTGDRGYLDHEGRLSITGREKDLIKLSGGENINPTPLEDALSESKYIATGIVIGEDSWKNLGALILPNFDELKEYYKDNNMTYDENGPLRNLVETQAKNKIPEIQKLYSKEINRLVNSDPKFKLYDHIRDFEFIEELTVGEELTATLKIIRHKVMKKYEYLVIRMRRKMTGR